MRKDIARRKAEITPIDQLFGLPLEILSNQKVYTSSEETGDSICCSAVVGTG